MEIYESTIRRPGSIEAKVVTLEPINAEALSKTAYFKDDEVRNIVLRYASLYLNNLLGRTNEAERYDFNKINTELDELERSNHDIWLRIGEIESSLIDQADEIMSQPEQLEAA